MRTFAFIGAIATFIVCFATGVDARVIAGDLDNGVAVYYFSSLSRSGNVWDYSGNGLHGSLFNNAQLSRISGRNCLSLGSNADEFQASNDNKPLSLSKEFSIVAWVRIPQQSNDFFIGIYAYNGPIDDIANGVGTEGGVTLGVFNDGTLFGAYDYDDGMAVAFVEATGRNVNNNQWQHIGFVINGTSMKLYLNGTQIASTSVSGHQSFSGSGSIVFIGYEARGSVDNVGFFKNDLSAAQVRLIYNQGLGSIISIASVDPGGKVATTWGALKQR